MVELDISDIYGFSKGLGKIDFHELVARDTGHPIIQYNASNTTHCDLLRNLSKVLNNFVRTSRKATRFTDNRINDIGSALEETITQEIRKMNLQSEKILGTGYPDLSVSSNDLLAYVEIKSSSIKSRGGSVNHRLFYYSTSKKIKVNALHLLLQIDLSEEQDKIWIVDGWVLRDLFGLKWF